MGHTSACEGRDFRPSNTEVGRFPKTITASRTKEKDTVAIRINNEALMELSARSISQPHSSYLSPVKENQ